MVDRTIRAATLGAVLLAAVAGCGSQHLVVAKDPMPTPYGGPLFVEVTEPDNQDVMGRAGAAARALECDGEPFNGSTGANYGLSGVYQTPTAALDGFIEDTWGSLPPTGYRREVSSERRVLFSFDVGGRTKIAVIVVSGVTSHHEPGQRGWAMETYAECDPSELPEWANAATGTQVWVDQHGRRGPTTDVESYQGPEHCEWDYMTFLVLNGDQYVGQGRLGFVEDKHGEFADLEDQEAPYDADVTLPPNAVETGFRRDGRELWIAADKSAAYLVGPTRVERWPASESMFLCA